MIRVLHVVGKMHRAGQETITMNLYRAIDRKQIQFDFLVHTHEKCEYDDEILSLGGRIFAVDKIGRGVVRYVRAIRRIVRDNGYTIVHLHTAHSAGFFVLMAAKWGGAKVRIAHSRNDNAELPWLHKLLRPLIRHYSTDRFACSTGAGVWMFGKRGRFTVRRNAIDTGAFCFRDETRRAARDALSLGDRLTVGHVGRFAPQKNHQYLFEVLRALYAMRPDFVALLVGTGDMMPSFQTLAETWGLAENIRFLGSRQDVPALMQAMDVFVFPSLYEGFGNVVVEAQASGLPVLAADTLTTETAVTDNIEYLPLALPPQAWAERIAAAHAGDRAASAATVADHGFDVYREAHTFETFYRDAAHRVG